MFLMNDFLFFLKLLKFIPEMKGVNSEPRFLLLLLILGNSLFSKLLFRFTTKVVEYDLREKAFNNDKRSFGVAESCI